MNLFRLIAVAFVVALLQGASLAQEAPKLTEVQRLEYELAKTQSQLHAALAERDGCRVELTPVRGEWVKATITKMKAGIEAAHPGYSLNVATGTLEPKPQAETEKPK
jgi:hypothetical protein